MKQINALNLIRIGLAKGLTVGVLTTPRYGKNWRMIPINNIKPLYERVIHHLAKKPYGEYFAIQELFGEQVAKRLVDKGDIKGLPVGGTS